MKETKTIEVELGEESYPILVGECVLDLAASYISPLVADRKCLVISDENVTKLYLNKLTDAISGAVGELGTAIITPGEENKNLNTVRNLYHQAVGFGLDRSSLIIALGGGVVGDIAGFVAATYMRGIDFIQIPTTLVAMVDSSVGGKTGVDLPEGKNLIGSFWQPKYVLIDPDTLETLPKRELHCGLAEVVKMALILDSDFFDLLEANTDKLNKPDLDFYSEVITRCCHLKACVVSEDAKENGLRVILNYGHSFAHAIETSARYQDVAHGEAVAVGMCLAADLAVKLRFFDAELAERQEMLLHALGLQCEIRGLESIDILAAMRHDKKNRDDQLRLVLPDAIGQATICEDIDDDLILETIQDRCE